MNCFDHPEEVAVANCVDCNKGLCNYCAHKYDFPICSQCNLQRVKYEKKQIIKDLFLIIGIGTLLFLFLKSSDSFYGTLNTTSAIVVFYLCYSVVAGWKFLNRITPQVFLFLPIIGWIIYFILKFMGAWIVGPFVLPFRLYKDIKRFIELNKIEEI